jgi:hypothetical protein
MPVVIYIEALFGVSGHKCAVELWSHDWFDNWIDDYCGWWWIDIFDWDEVTLGIDITALF